ncbi:MAG: hypothetical protein R3B47_02735 [Bacteroidia bacterium]
MQQIFPNACFIAFTGTPLMKKEKSTAQRFGGIVKEAIYTIKQAVEDGAVVPLLYEGRHSGIDVNAKPLNAHVDRVMEPLTDHGKAELKRKFSTRRAINAADQLVYERALDISAHFVQNYQGTGLKGQLVAPSKITAIRFKEYLDELGEVSSEVIFSPPDVREGSEDAYSGAKDEVQRFWKTMMDKHGNARDYEKNIIDAFKKRDTPEIIIVVDKLLTGFDAPPNAVMYLTRPLKDHTLLQAIARVNRLHPDKEYGLIVDYYGNLGNLDSAVETWALEGDYDLTDLDGTITQVSAEVNSLPQLHSELWDTFKTIENRYDEQAYEEILADDILRYQFYERVSAFARMLKLALSSVSFINDTPQKQVEKYKSDAKFFIKLRQIVKRRYFDDAEDYEKFEAQIKKLIDKHITTDGEVIALTGQIDIFNREAREHELEKLESTASKADHIASRSIKAINEKLEEDPVYYQKMADLIKQAIDDYHADRISEVEYFNKAKQYERAIFEEQAKRVPEALRENPASAAFFHLFDSMKESLIHAEQHSEEPLVSLALDIDALFKEAFTQTRSWSLTGNRTWILKAHYALCLTMCF